MYVSPLVCATRRSLATGEIAYRVCFDASRELNERIEKWPIRYADLRHILMLMRDNDWVSSIDLSSFYLHMPLHMFAQDYLQLRDPYTCASKNCSANVLTRRNPLFHIPPDALIPPPLATDPAAVSAADPFRDFWRFDLNLEKRWVSFISRYQFAAFKAKFEFSNEAILFFS